MGDAGVTHQMVIDREHPWPWLEAFTEEAQDFFNGRDDDTEALLRCVLAAPATVLFGKSGLGKTSLVQAGLAPRLRQRRLLPVLVRIDQHSEQPASAQLLNRLNAAVEAAGLRWQSPARPGNASSVSQLWEQLHDTEVTLVDAERKRWTPIFVLDQFEEAFTLIDDGPQRQRLFAELGDLIEGRIPPEVAQRLDAHDMLLDRIDPDRLGARFVLSLREDYLADLEVWADRIPRLGPNRSRLLPMSPKQALAAVQQTGGALVVAAAARHIVDFLGRQGQQDGAASATRLQWIEPALLSLICAGLNQHRLDQRPAAEQLDTRSLDTLGSQLLERFYDAAFAALPAERRVTAEAFVERELITSDGTRRPFPREAAERAGLSSADLGTLTQNRLLRVDNTEVGDFVELVHDRVAAIAAQRAHRAKERAEAAEREAERLEKEKRRRQRNRLLAVTVLIVLLVAALGCWGMWTQRKAAERARDDALSQKAEAERQKAEAVQAKASATIAEAEANKQANLALEQKNEADRRRTEAVKAGIVATEAERAAQRSAIKAEQSASAARVAESVAQQALSDARNAEQLAKMAETKASAEAARAWTAEQSASAAQLISDSRNLLSGQIPGGFERALRKILRAYKLRPEIIAQAPIGLDELASGYKWSSAPTEELLCVAFSPDGLRLVTGSRNRNLQLWDARSGQRIGAPIGGHQGAIYAVVFSPDGTRIASASKDGTLRLWDSRAGEPTGDALRGHFGAVTSVAFSPDGLWLVSGGYDRTLRLWDARTGRPFGEPFRGHTGAVTSVAFSHDGQRIVSGSADQTVQRWNTATGAPTGLALKGHTGAITSVAFSPPDVPAQIVSGSDDQTLRLWNADTGQPIGQPLQGHDGAVRSVGYSPDGRHLMSAGDDQSVRMWDAGQRQVIAELATHRAQAINHLAFSPEGARLAFVGPGTVQMWNVSDPQKLTHSVAEIALPTSSRVTSIAADPHGSDFVSGHQDGTLTRWQVGPGTVKPVATVRGHAGAVYAMALQPGETSRLVSGSKDGRLHLWDAKTLQALGVAWGGNSGAINSVAFSPDGRTIVSGSEDRTLQRWNADTRQPIGESMRGHSGPVYSVGFSRDGQRILSGSADNTLRLWDAMTGAPRSEPLKKHTAAVTAVAFSPTAANIAVSAGQDKTLLLWDLDLLIPIKAPLKGHTGAIYGVSFNAEGSRIVSAGADATLRLWDTGTGKMLGQPLAGHTQAINSVAFLNGSEDLRLISAGQDDMLRTWLIRKNTTTWPQALCANMLHGPAPCPSRAN